MLAPARRHLDGMAVVSAPVKRLASGACASPVNGVEPSPTAVAERVAGVGVRGRAERQSRTTRIDAAIVRAVHGAPSSRLRGGGGGCAGGRDRDRRRRAATARLPSPGSGAIVTAAAPWRRRRRGALRRDSSSAVELGGSAAARARRDRSPRPARAGSEGSARLDDQAGEAGVRVGRASRARRGERDIKSTAADRRTSVDVTAVLRHCRSSARWRVGR